jgi:magnesium transporter
VAPPDAERPHITAIGYGPRDVSEVVVGSVAELAGLKGRWPVLWVNVSGLGDAAVVAQVGETFGLHRLALEDVLSPHQRAKVEDYGDHVFLVARVFEGYADGTTEADQLGLFLGDGFVVTFQETRHDVFDPVRERIRRRRALQLEQGADYLAYTLLDAVVDQYFPMLERQGERLEELEDAVLSHPTRESMTAIHALRREMLQVRRVVWPLRESVSALQRLEGRFHAGTRIYLRDLYDHTAQLMDLLENYREVASGLVDVYLSSMSNRMNEVMKVLTIISTIFIPLGFVAGVYGMNFRYMPELDWKWGYGLAWFIILAIGGGLLYYFWRRGWLRRE